MPSACFQNSPTSAALPTRARADDHRARELMSKAGLSHDRVFCADVPGGTSARAKVVSVASNAVWPLWQVAIRDLPKRAVLTGVLGIPAGIGNRVLGLLKRLA